MGYSISWDDEAGAGHRSKVSSFGGPQSTRKGVRTSRWVWVSLVPHSYAVREHLGLLDSRVLLSLNNTWR